MSRDNREPTSPRGSLQAKNTKNLSLNIEQHVSPESLPGSLPGSLPLPLPLPRSQSRPVGLENRFRRPQLCSRASDAAIYTNVPGPAKRGGAEADAAADAAPRIRAVRPARVRSLCVRTTALEPRAAPARPASVEPRKQTWVFPGRDRGNKTQKHAEDPGGASPGVPGDVYPEGPLCVIPPCVYLYSEPTPQQVESFDVVINVAAEIADLAPHAHGRGVEYVRVPWSHSSQIAADLTRLTESIHVACQRGHRVLVHCQCGVSRSASLVVAYIMRYEQISVNEAYTRLKSVARGISPNLGLVFQLMEWGETVGPGGSEHSSQETTPNTPGEYFKSGISSASSGSTL